MFEIKPELKESLRQIIPGEIDYTVSYVRLTAYWEPYKIKHGKFFGWKYRKAKYAPPCIWLSMVWLSLLLG